MTFKLDHQGAAEVLKELAANEIRALAKQVASQSGDAVWVNHYTTDRAAAAVTIPAARQAKHGTLTRAAASVGLEVHAK